MPQVNQRHIRLPATAPSRLNSPPQNCLELGEHPQRLRHLWAGLGPAGVYFADCPGDFPTEPISVNPLAASGVLLVYVVRGQRRM